MDYLRSCYSTDMQFDLAGNIVGKVKWYWAAKGAKIFPYQNSFSSDNWITPSNSTLGLGEVWNSPRPWRNGSLLVVPPGDGHVCGDISWFTDGCPSDAPPLPRSPSGLALCCSTGGLLLGGSWKRRFGGGLLLSGDYTLPPICQGWNGTGTATRHVLNTSTFLQWFVVSTSSPSTLFQDFSAPFGHAQITAQNTSPLCTPTQLSTKLTIANIGVSGGGPLTLQSVNPALSRGLWLDNNPSSHYFGTVFQFDNPP
jgi:hypothetical protein